MIVYCTLFKNMNSKAKVNSFLSFRAKGYIFFLSFFNFCLGQLLHYMVIMMNSHGLEQFLNDLKIHSS